MLELYHWEPNANSAEPLICLTEKGLEFTSHYVDLLQFEQHSPAFLGLNPEGQVPVLVHDGRVITETSLMLLYLDAAFPAVSLLPPSAAERYRMHVWARVSNDYFAPALMLLGWHAHMVPRMEGRDLGLAAQGLLRLPPERQVVWRAALSDSYSEAQLATAHKSLEIVATRLEEALSSFEWLAGSRYSLADIAIFPMAQSLASLLPDVVNAATTPGTALWLQRVRARPAVQKVLNMARNERPEQLFAPGPETGRWG
jgi:GST-like protein